VPWRGPGWAGLKAEKARPTNTEAVVSSSWRQHPQAPARNIRIDVKMFNAGQTQEQEIGAFFRSAGRESTKCHLPGIAPTRPASSAAR
jgi:hypothetical protein